MFFHQFSIDKYSFCPCQYYHERFSFCSGESVRPLISFDSRKYISSIFPLTHSRTGHNLMLDPFLLAEIYGYIGSLRSFKISEVDPNLFWIENKKRDWKQLHNFFWLNLIDRKTDSKNIKKIIYIWMLRNSQYKKKIWEMSILSNRIVSWILNIDIILDHVTFDFKRNFLNTIISQCNHLKKNIKF